MTEPEISWKNYYTFYTMTGSKPIYIPKKDIVTVIISLLSGIIYSMNYLMRQIFSKIMWRLLLIVKKFTTNLIQNLQISGSEKMISALL